MRACIVKDSNTVRASTSGVMEAHTLVIGFKTRSVDKASMCGLMDANTSDLGKRTKCTDMDSWLGLMVDLSLIHI